MRGRQAFGVDGRPPERIDPAAVQEERPGQLNSTRLGEAVDGPVILTLCRFDVQLITGPIPERGKKELASMKRKERHEARGPRSTANGRTAEKNC